MFFLNRPEANDFFEGVSNATPHKAKPRAPMKVTSANKVFWVRPANAELDRSGLGLVDTRAEPAVVGAQVEDGIAERLSHRSLPP